MTSGPVIAASELTKSYGTFRAVDSLNFEIEPGLFYGLLGPNGAGKTTAMRMVYQVTPPTSGRLEIFGLPSGVAAREIKARMGVVPQIDNLDEELSVEDNLLIYARFNQIGGARARRRAAEMLEFVELAGKRKANVAALSGGMKRRLTLARGLMNEPQLLVLDEPTTGLDPQVRLALWEKLDALRSQGMTILMSTHYMDEAERLSDHLLIMDGGRIITQGTPREVIGANLPAQVVEVRGRSARGDMLERFALARGLEWARSGERASLFVDDGAAVLSALTSEGIDPHAMFVRPSNLEDVFLRLTGRSLRE